jgi:Cys-rich protein (TIGR01571 family)
MDGSVENFFCFRCQLSRQYNQVTNGVNQIEPWTFMGSLVADMLMGLPITACLFTWYLRNRVRGRYQIVGDDFNDCMISLFCNPCSGCQVYREMSLRGEWPAGCCIHQPFQIRMPPQVQIQ